MALSANARLSLRAEFGALISDRREAFNLTKAQLDAAIAAVDDWLEANASSLNQAIPQPARGALTPPQKAEILALVALRRFRG